MLPGARVRLHSRLEGVCLACVDGDVAIKYVLAVALAFSLLACATSASFHDVLLVQPCMCALLPLFRAQGFG